MVCGCVPEGKTILPTLAYRIWYKTNCGLGTGEVGGGMEERKLEVVVFTWPNLLESRAAPTQSVA